MSIQRRTDGAASPGNETRPRGCATFGARTSSITQHGRAAAAQPLPDRFAADGGVCSADSRESAFLAQARRVGEATFGQICIALRSEHRYVGSSLKSDTPVGYLL